MKKKIRDCTGYEILSNWETNKDNLNCVNVASIIGRLCKNLSNSKGEFDLNLVEEIYDGMKNKMKINVLETEIEVEDESNSN